MKNSKHIFLQWLPFVVMGTLTAMLVFGAVQQTMRQTANSPQVQIAEDVAAVYASGQAQDFSAQGRRDISKTLSPFIIVFDAAGKPIAGNAELNGIMPTPPAGVFEHAKAKGENRFTWQPEPSVRIAAVIMPYTLNSKEAVGTVSGFVLAGRSLRETQHLIETIRLDILFGWIIMMVFSFITIVFVNLMS